VRDVAGRETIKKENSTLANMGELHSEEMRLLASPPAATPALPDDDIVTGFMESRPENSLSPEVRDTIEQARYDAPYTHDKNLNINLGEETTAHQVTETDLVHNPLWIEASRRLMPLFEESPTKSTEVSDEDAAQWGLEMMGWFNYNLPSMAMNTARIQSGDNAQKMALYYLMNMYDEKEIDWNGTKRFFKGILSDPSTYIGLGTLGIGTVAGASVRQASKVGVKAALKASLGPSLAGVVEGGAYSSIDDAFRQSVAINAGARAGFNAVQSAAAGAIGSIAGGALTLTGGTAVPLTKKAVETTKGFVQRLFGG